MTHKEAVLDVFMRKAYNNKGSSFIGFLQVGPKETIQILPRNKDSKVVYTPGSSQSIDVEGNTVAHVFSITKITVGLAMLWVMTNKDKNKYPNHIFTDLESEVLQKKATVAKFINPNRQHFLVNMPIHNVPVISFFNQTSGIKTDIHGFNTIINMYLMYKSHAVAPKLFNAFLCENFISQTNDKTFEYNNTLTWWAGVLLEDYMQRVAKDPSLTIKRIMEEIFFPPAFKTLDTVKHWPMVNAGYKYTIVKEVVNDGVTYLDEYESDAPVQNTTVYASLRFSGKQLMQWGEYMLRKHYDLLLRIYNDKETTCDFEKEGYSHDRHGHRKGWRYTMFFWIPVLNDNRKWISAIGMQGQYLTFELDTKSVFVRQHFVVGLAENVDVANMITYDNPEIAYSEFVTDCSALLNDINNDSKIKM